MDDLVRIKTDSEDIFVRRSPRNRSAASILNAVSDREKARDILERRPLDYCSFCIKQSDVLVVSRDGLVAICPSCIDNAAETIVRNAGDGTQCPI